MKHDLNTLDRAERATVLAALKLYLDLGMDEPANRAEDIQALATCNGDDTSLDSASIKHLMTRFADDPQANEKAAKPVFTPDSEVMALLIRELRYKGLDSVAYHVEKQHPGTLDTDHVVATGGGCQALFVEIHLGGGKALVVWTDQGGMSLPEPDDYMVGVYYGAEITEDVLVSIEGPKH
ncbi:hypothetical protein AWH63_10910 [Marinobacter sp. C18]|uniref:hypothetical protein n=1 Tax=Marinobacter sp. C18 TaxID=1772288 RepID=UPI000948B378|nr:hypothetical protein [Marinobacter sp. C18]OLF82041.1 hypothetical protein AWH63_10910 [Marinobacter sp. C18]